MLYSQCLAFYTIGYAIAWLGSLELAGLVTMGLTLRWLKRRSWLKAHPEKVVTALIPRFLQTQINYTDTSLLGSGSRFGLAGREMLKMVEKGQNMKYFIEGFCTTNGKDRDLPPYLAKKQKESEACLRFDATYDLLMASDKLLRADFAAKREEAGVFNRSLSAGMQEKKNLALAQEDCLAQVRDWCQGLNMLSDKFNRFLDESRVSKLGSDIMLSKDMEKMVIAAKYRAENLLQKLTDFYGVNLEELKEEPPKEEGKAGEPSTGGVHLTEEDLRELEDLDLDSIDK